RHMSVRFSGSLPRQDDATARHDPTFRAGNSPFRLHHSLGLAKGATRSIASTAPASPRRWARAPAGPFHDRPFSSTCFLSKLSARTLHSQPQWPMLPQSSFGRTTWPRRAPRVGLTTFLQISNEPAALARGLLSTPT